jgi:hypothetical protein
LVIFLCAGAILFLLHRAILFANRLGARRGRVPA